jgi:hypothetical protein
MTIEIMDYLSFEQCVPFIFRCYEFFLSLNGVYFWEYPMFKSWIRHCLHVRTHERDVSQDV